jgi:predicted nucleic acid-binding protein
LTGPLVVDASVAIKWVLEEEGSAAARRLVGAALIAPDLLLTECTNVIWKRVKQGDLAAGFAAARLGALRRTPVRLTPSVDLLDRALQLAIELAHPIYDCLYLALTIEAAGVLVTDDARLVRSVNGHAALAGRVRPLVGAA